MKHHIIAMSLGAAVFAPVSFAESDLYITGGVSSFDYNGANLNAATVRGGWNFNETLGAEVEGSIGLGSDETISFEEDIEVDAQYAAYLVGRLPVTSNLSLFSRVGYSRTEFKLGGSWITRQDGVAFGVGAQYMFTDWVGLRADYTALDRDATSISDGIDVFSISGVVKLGDPR